MKIITKPQKSFTLAVSLLLAALFTVNLKVKADPEPEPQAAAVGCLVVIFVVGGVIVVYGLWKICDRAFPPPPPKTNPPPPPPKTNGPPVTNFTANTYSMGLANYNFRMTLEQSAAIDGDWKPAAFVEATINGDQIIFVTTDTNGVPIMTNVAPIDVGENVWVATNDLQSVIRAQGDPQRFWRVK